MQQTLLILYIELEFYIQSWYNLEYCCISNYSDMPLSKNCIELNCDKMKYDSMITVTTLVSMNILI